MLVPPLARSSLVGLPPPAWPPGLGEGRARAGEPALPPVRDCGPMEARELALLLELLLLLFPGVGEGDGDGDGRKVAMPVL